nr:hypothetical protein [Tanacetum cinerariifolium]
MYDSWASRIMLYIKGKKHGRMMLDSIDDGPLVYLTIEVEGVVRPKKYSKLSTEEQLQDDCDVQDTNIILYGLPPDTVIQNAASQTDDLDAYDSDCDDVSSAKVVLMENLSSCDSDVLSEVPNSKT